MSDHVAAAAALVRQLNDLASANRLKEAQDLLVPLKIAVAQFPSAEGEDAKLKQNLLAREAFELSALVCVQSNQIDAFERNMLQLKQYYFDSSIALPQSERHFPILGLHLLSLLAHNRIAEFHSELELIPLEAHEQNQYIRYARELEQHYMEGSYGKVLRAAASVPLPYYATFTQLLTETVRQKVADCCEKAYKNLPVAAAGQMLFLEASKMPNFCAARGWIVSNGIISFASSGDAALTIPSQSIIKDMFAYAHELERIV